MLCRKSAELDTDGSAITRKLLQPATACCFIYTTRVPSFDLPAEEGPHREELQDMQTGCLQKSLLCMLACLSGCGASLSSLNYSCDATCQQGQRSALSMLYRGCGGAYWLNNSGWHENEELPDSSWSSTAHCSWYGVLCCDLNTSSLPGFPSSSASCSSPGAVLGLALQQNNLSQQLPDAGFAALQSLVQIDLRGKQQLYNVTDAHGACRERLHTFIVW